MTGDITDSAVKIYESCVFDQLLGDTLRPGGLELTDQLAGAAGIGKAMKILDIACGKGATTMFLARKYECQVTGIDLSAQMISRAEGKVAAEGLSGMISFCSGDAENLPFPDESFDVVVSECAFSLMPDKEKAAGEIHRVLRRSGRLAMTDIVLRGAVDNTLRDQVGMVCCMSGAVSADEYTSLFTRAGFHSPYMEDHSDQLRKVVFRMGVTFGSMDGFMSHLPTGPCSRKTSAEHQGSAQAYLQFVKQGRPGYVLLIMSKA